MNSTYTVKEAAQVLGLTPSRVRQLTASGVIASTLTPGKYGPTRVIAAEALEAYRTVHEVPVQPEDLEPSVPRWMADAKDAKIARLTEERDKAQKEATAAKAGLQKVTKKWYAERSRADALEAAAQQELSAAQQDRVSADNAARAQHGLITEYAHKVLTLDAQKDQFIDTQRQHIEALSRFNVMLTDSLRRVLETEAHA